MNIFVGIFYIIVGLTMLAIAGGIAWDLWSDWKFEKKLKEEIWEK